MENRHLDTYVKHLSFDGQSPMVIWTPGKQPKLTDGELKMMEEFIHAAELPLETLWTAELKKGSVNVFLALIVSQLFNLQTLRLRLDFHTDTNFVGLLFKQRLSLSLFPSKPHIRLSTFSNLQHVEFQDLSRSWTAYLVQSGISASGTIWLQSMIMNGQREHA